MWIHCLLRLQECRDKPEIFNYQRIQLSNNKFTNGFLGGTLNLAWLQCLSKQGYSTKDYTHGSREAVSHPEKSINVQGTFHFDTPSQNSPCTASRGDNMITTFISDWNGHNIPSSRRDDMITFLMIIETWLHGACTSTTKMREQVIQPENFEGKRNVASKIKRVPRNISQL